MLDTITIYRCPVCGCFTTPDGDCDHRREDLRSHCTVCGRFIRDDDPQACDCPTTTQRRHLERKGFLARKGN